MASRNVVPRGVSMTACPASCSMLMVPCPASGWPSGATMIRSSSKRGSDSRPASATGVFTMAMSRSPFSTLGVSDVVVASTRTGWRAGWRSSSRLNSGVAIQRPVVPMHPIRTSPATSWRIETMSSLIACSSVRIRRARSRTAWPSEVGCIVCRSTSTAPSSFSSLATCVETFDCTVWRARAAAEKLRCSATAMRWFSWRRSIARNDAPPRAHPYCRWTCDGGPPDR